MRTLGSDPSLTGYGWAIHDSDATGLKRRVASGHENTLPSTVPVARFMHFQSLISSLIDKYKPDVFGIESPAYGAGPFQSIHFGLMMFSLVPVFESRIDCALFDPATLKLLAKGDPKEKRGAMGKLDMQRKVQLDTLDPNIIDNNEADAYLVAYFATRLTKLIRGELDPSELTPSEKRVFILRTRTIKTIKGKKIRHVGHVFRENSRFFEYSRIPAGSVALPNKHEIKKDILNFIEDLEG